MLVRKGFSSCFLFFSMLLLSVQLSTRRAEAQTYLNATGAPTWVTLAKLDQGFLNLANGNPHMEFPLGTFGQRGKLKFSAKLVYDGRIYQVVNGAWQPTNVANPQGGWRFVTSADPGSVTETLTSTTCNPGQFIQTWQAFTWTDSDGTQRAFPITTTQNQCTGSNTATGDAFAQDSSGFHMYVTNFTSATVFAKDGTQVYPTVEDTNGNFFSVDGSGNVVDTLNRTPITKTVNGNITYYDVLNSQGSTSRFTVTTITVNANTAFGQTGVSEYSGSFNGGAEHWAA